MGAGFITGSTGAIAGVATGCAVAGLSAAEVLLVSFLLHAMAETARKLTITAIFNSDLELIQSSLGTFGDYCLFE